MNWLDDIKIGKKLIGSFVAVAFLLVGLAWMGWHNSSTMSQQSDLLFKDKTLPIEQLGRANTALYAVRGDLFKMLLIREERDASEKALRANMAAVEEQYKLYSSSVSEKDETEAAKQFEAAWKDYRVAVEKTIGLINKGDEKSAIRELMNGGEVANLRKQCDQYLQKLSDIAAEGAGELNKQTEVTYKSSSTMSGIVSVVAVLLAVALGFILTRSITVPVQRGLQMMQEMSKGKLDTRLKMDRKDEIGHLARSMDEFSDDLQELVGTLKKVAAGDLSKTVVVKDSQDEISPAINQTVESLRSLIAEMDRMSKEHNAGDIEVRIPEEKFEGSYRTMAKGVNEMVFGHIAVKKKAMACIAEFGKGNFEAELEKFPGKKAFINATIEQVRENLKALIIDADALVKAAVQGQLSTRADVSRHQGDFRKIVQGVNSTLDAVIGPMQDVSTALGKLAGGDLTVTITKKYAGDFETLTNALNTLSTQVRSAMEQIGRNVAALASSAEELNRVSQTMGSSADQTATQANVVSAATEQVSRNVQTVATGADEMSASIKEIAKNTAEATRVATSAVRTAEATNETISKLGQSSAEIGQVIKVITSIAQQTNLLALNATIEAARAGEAGKGFAVVANEVKELAKETAKATEDISRKIEAIQGDTNGSISAINQISQVIGQISDIQNTIASAIEEQSATTNEIGRNLAEAAKGSTDITKNVGGVAEAARATTVGATDTLKSAQGLEKMAAELQTLVAQFRC